MILLLKIIGRSFARWWNKLGYSMLSSILGALNPFFILMILSCLWLLTGKLPVVMQKPSFYLTIAGLLFALQGVFPTTVYAIAMQKRVNEGDIMYIKDYFPDYIDSIKKFTLPSIFLTLFYAVIAYFIMNSIFFYYYFPVSGSIKAAIITVLILLYLYFMLVQYILVPLLLYREKIKFFDALKIAMGATGLNLITIGGMFIVDTILFSIMTVLAGCSILFYYSFSCQFRLNLYTSIIQKYIDKKA
jgi:hypothetical protein